MKGIRIINYLSYEHSWSLVENDGFFFNPNTPLLGIQILWICSVQNRIAWQGESGSAARESLSFCQPSFYRPRKRLCFAMDALSMTRLPFFTCPQIKHSLISEKRVCVRPSNSVLGFFIMCFLVEIIGLSDEVVGRGTVPATWLDRLLCIVKAGSDACRGWDEPRR